MIISKKTARNLSSGINESVASKPTDFGKRMLEKMGWQEGQGLGADGQGIKPSVKVDKKDDTKGLGNSKEQQIAESNKQDWNDVFKTAALSIAPKVSSRKRSDSTSSSSSSSSLSSSEEDDNGIDLSQLSEADRQLFLICGKRRLGRRANRAQKGKWKREAEADRKLLEKASKKLKDESDNVKANEPQKSNSSSKRAITVDE